jgi:hypothetical protein
MIRVKSFGNSETLYVLYKPQTVDSVQRSKDTFMQLAVCFPDYQNSNRGTKN